MEVFPKPRVAGATLAGEPPASVQTPLCAEKRAMLKLVLIYSLPLVACIAVACGDDDMAGAGEEGGGGGTEAAGSGAEAGSVAEGGSGGENGSDGGVSINDLGTECSDQGTCPEGLAAVEYCGIAGCDVGGFCTCEITCGDDPQACPTGSECVTISDGPGPVCLRRVCSTSSDCESDALVCCGFCGSQTCGAGECWDSGDPCPEGQPI